MDTKFVFVATSIWVFGICAVYGQEKPDFISLMPYEISILNPQMEIQKLNSIYRIEPEFVGFLEASNENEQKVQITSKKAYRFSHGYFHNEKLILTNVSGSRFMGPHAQFVQEMPSEQSIVTCKIANDLYEILGENYVKRELLFPPAFRNRENWSENLVRYSQDNAGGIDVVEVRVVYLDKNKERSKISEIAVYVGKFRKANGTNEDRVNFPTGDEIVQRELEQKRQKQARHPENIKEATGDTADFE